MSRVWDDGTSTGSGMARKQRDLYLEMKRLENPNFAHIPIQDIRSELNMEGDCGTSANAVATSLMKSAQSSGGTRAPYECLTQQEETLDQLFLGVVKGSIVLWETGATINWVARMDGFPNRQMAMDAATATYKAAARWNESLGGRVRFQYVTTFDDACFQVAYGGDRGGVLASAFFPDQYENSLNSVLAYKGMFSRGQKPLMVSTMLHELGHVLGLRHEHSHAGIPGWIPPEDQANGAESIVWGVRNPRSVMAYYQGQEIQESDTKAICEAYDELVDGKVISGTGRFGSVQKTIRRVPPNN